MCSHAPSQVALAAARRTVASLTRRTVKAPMHEWPHGEPHGFACRSGCAGRLVASDGFAAIYASARIRCCLCEATAGHAASGSGRARQRSVRARPAVAGASAGDRGRVSARAAVGG